MPKPRKERGFRAYFWAIHVSGKAGPPHYSDRGCGEADSAADTGHRTEGPQRPGNGRRVAGSRRRRPSCRRYGAMVAVPSPRPLGRLDQDEPRRTRLTTALAASQRRLTFREQPDDPVGPAGDQAGVAVAEGPDAPRERQRPALTATRDDLARPRARSVRRPLQSCETVRQGARNALRLRGFVSGQSTGHKPRVDPAV